MEQKKYTPAGVTAHLLSDIFSPLLTPTYAMIAAMWLTPLRYLPLAPRLWATLGVAAITALVPLVLIAILIHRGKVSDASISDRSQRTVPYCTAIVCYLLAGSYLMALHAPIWLIAFFGAAAVVTLISLTITHWWKISAHSGGIAGLAALIYWMGYHGLIMSAPLVWISVAIAVAGAVAWARLYLRHHTVMQVFAGAILSAGIVYTVLSLF
ncbi:MAG: hypothetical protein NC418_11405 [Muribaculaceae bacterium]|nr:hypothetical protein [Muribaculaceae bacterium]